MLSLLNKSRGDKAAVQIIPWRPDFRDVAQLPDTKTVRTDFFVNLVAVVLAGSFALYVAQREWSILGLNQSLADVEERIAAARPASEKAQAAYKLFQAEEAKFNEAFALVRDPFRLQDFLVHLGSVLPPGVSVRRIDFRGPGQNVFLAGSVKGLDAAASDVASAFVKQLQSDKVLANFFESVTLTNLGRNVDEGSLNVELVFAFAKADAKGAVKK